MLGMHCKFSLSISSSYKFLPIPVSSSFFSPNPLQILDQYLSFKVKVQDFYWMTHIKIKESRESKTITFSHPLSPLIYCFPLDYVL